MRIASSRLITIFVLTSMLVAGGNGGLRAQVAATENDSELTSYRWDFGRSSDRNYDGWPDDWRRREGIGYPAYVDVSIVAHDPDLSRQLEDIDQRAVKLWPMLRRWIPSLPVLPPSLPDLVVDRYLRIRLDGGQFSTQSPRIRASRQFQYAFSCRVKTHGLHHDNARAEFAFLDREGRELVSYSTDSISGTSQWTPVSFGPVRPPTGATGMVVRLMVEHGEDGLEDIYGEIGFDDVRIDQLPQLQLATDSIHGLYQTGEPVTATVKILGLPKGTSRVHFQLRDKDGRTIDTESRELTLAARPDESSTVSTTDSAGTDIHWQIPACSPGFYSVAATLHRPSASTLRSETTFAVVEELVAGPPHGSFGWTLPEGNLGMRPRELARWLTDAGVAWVKYPCWIDPEETAAAESVATTLSKLQDAGIETVGLLDRPPQSDFSIYSVRSKRELVAAHLFRDVTTWQPRLEPVMSRLSLRVRRWQLGGERDYSFLGRPRLKEVIADIASGLQGFGQPIDVAISWPWLEAPLSRPESSWQAICRSSEPPLGAKELDAFLSLQAEEVGDAPRTWLLLDPVSSEVYDHNARIQDLVLRMATIRKHRVQAAFVSNPRDPTSGLLRRDGRPGELLLPWRTTSRLIGNLRRAGRLRLRGGSQNIVFTGKHRAVLMLWSASPTQERLFLGDDARQVDVWGKTSELELELENGQPVHRVPVGPMPVFVTGVDPTLLALRMSVSLQPSQLDSILQQPQELTVSITNPTSENMIGQMRLVAPDKWTVTAPDWRWELLPGRSTPHAFDISLGNTTKIGSYEVPIQLQLETTPPQRITVYRTVTVGPVGVQLKTLTRMLKNGELLVQVEMTNQTDEAQAYDCSLFPPGARQFERRFVTIEPRSTIRREFYWSGASDLIGQKMKLRASEQDGPRVLNYEFTIQP